jgi:hypothetical protein
VLQSILSSCAPDNPDFCLIPGNQLRFIGNPQKAIEQVRRPIFRESVDQWRHFEPWLDALKTALGNLVDLYPGIP